MYIENSKAHSGASSIEYFFVVIVQGEGSPTQLSEFYKYFNQ